jgi:signal transduction histidine kinase
MSASPGTAGSVVPESRPRPVPWVPILAIWTAYGLLLSAQYYVTSVLASRPAIWWVGLLLQMPQALVWGLATPGILWLGRRFPFERGRWPLSVAVHAVGSFGFVFLISLGYVWHAPDVLPVAYPATPLLTRAQNVFAAWGLADALLWWLVLAVGYAVDRDRKLRERQLVAAELETQLARADLQALKMQLHPHFLFNALHTIGSLVRTGDRDNAVRVTAGLGALLRRMLDHASQQEVPLKEELDFVRAYLEIEQIRFRDRLRIRIDADESVLDAKVPYLILQPLVENAIRHGIAPHLFAGLVAVKARRVDGRLVLAVRDDGPGVGEGDAARPGIGLTNTRARLERLYGGRYTLAVTNGEAGGLEARIELPFALAPAEWEGER